MEKIIISLEQLKKAHNICDWIKYYAVITWHKISFVRRSKKLRIFETTITQDLLFHFLLFAYNKELNIDMFEAIDEKTNGNDIEIVLQLDEGYVKFPFQAKLIYKNGKYEKIGYQKKGRFQVDDLIEYAERINGYPWYLLYNHVDKNDLLFEIEDKTKTPYEYWGITCSSAYSIKNHYNYKPSFYDIHPLNGFPFYMFFECIYSNRNTKKILESMGINRYVKTFNTNEIYEDDQWLDINSIPEFSDLNYRLNLKKDIGQLDKNSGLFKPRYRIVFSRNKQFINTDYDFDIDEWRV